MRRILFVLAVLLVNSTAFYAQDAKKTLKNASKELVKYYQDQASNAGSLKLAIQMVNEAFADETVKTDPEAWLTKGEIYNTIADAEIKKALLDPNYVLENPNAALEASMSFGKAISLAAKKHHTKDAVNNLKETESHLNNAGIIAFQKSDYPVAFKNFNEAVEVAKVLKSYGSTSRLDDEAVKNDHYFYTAVAGYYGKLDKTLVQPYLMDLYNNKKYMETKEPKLSMIYEALYNFGGAEGITYLEEGRKMFPEDSGLLFSEINYYLGKGELDKLIEKLKLAQKAEPNNVSIYNTMGNVYDQLIIKEKNNPAKANEYFDLAYDYYNQALEKDPKNFDATYSIGALYYNKAATYTDKLNELGNDFSSEGTKKYNNYKAEMDGLFEKALPYFDKAHAINATDVNTLIALKEIYARKNDFTKSNEYKKMLENLSGK